VDERRLTEKELVFVVRHEDVTASGSMKDGRTVHIGRIAHRNGDVVALACGKKPDVKWLYSFHKQSLMLNRTCQHCIDITKPKVDFEMLEVVTLPFTPVSNTGVN
jgi:hypothetical protein